VNPGVVIVGASIAGVSVAESLRGNGFADPITIIGAEPHLPYDRTLLSKQALADDFDPGRFALRQRSDYEDSGIELKLDCRALSFDGQTRTLGLSDGRELAGDYVVIATGARPRTLGGLLSERIHVLRDRADANRLRAGLKRARSVAIVGGGLIGCELASSIRALGLEVTILEATELPMARALGRDVAAALVRIHESRGVRVISGKLVHAVHESSHDVRIELADGSDLHSDIAVVGLGTQANTEWLNESRLEIDDGIVCDNVGRTSATGVYAAGDVAVWQDGSGSGRCQHWTRARRQAAIVAGSICGLPVEASDEPDYFWSDQYGWRLQCFGNPLLADRARLVWGEYEDERFLSELARGDRVVALIGVRAGRKLRERLGTLQSRSERQGMVAAR